MLLYMFYDQIKLTVKMLFHICRELLSNKECFHIWCSNAGAHPFPA